MDRRKIIIDTTVLIDHLRKSDKRKSLLFTVIGKHDLFISAVSIFELYAGATDQRKTRDIEIIMGTLESLPLSTETAQKAGQLYLSLKKENLTLEIRDLFIGATAIIHKLPLLTFNKRHFERIKEISLFDDYS
jgi:tRNA(fMet)-specific endonuclease VapC